MMPIIESQAQRDALIDDCKMDIEITKRYIHLYGETPGLISKLIRQQIALAALEAESDITVLFDKHRREGNALPNYNEMPVVVSCNWKPDGEHKYYSALPVPMLKPVVAPKNDSYGARGVIVKERDAEWIATVRAVGYPIAGEDQ